MTRPNTLTISRSRLAELVREEIDAVIKAQEEEKEDEEIELLAEPPATYDPTADDEPIDEANPYHSSATGRFTDKSGEIYSLTKNAKDNVSKIPVGRGKNKAGKPVAKFGMNTGAPEKQCGRLTIDGDKKKKSRSCSNYPKNYWDKQNEELDLASGLPVSDEEGRQQRTPQKRKDKLGVMPAELSKLARGLMEDAEIFEAATTLRRLSGIPEGLVTDGNEALAGKCRAAGFRTFEELLKAMDAMKRASDGKLLDPKGGG